MRKKLDFKFSKAGTFILGIGLLVLLGWGIAHPLFALAREDRKTFLPLVVSSSKQQSAPNAYVVIGWNDLGMHCYDLDYSVMAVLPPYNNLFAQVVQRGNPPSLVTAGVSVSYGFPDNTYSAGKTNFWEYADELFGVSLAPNIGLTGKGLAGDMDPRGDHFVAEGIPITEFSDSQPLFPDYLQLANLVARDQAGKVLAQTQVVAPVSSEMRCDVCHNEPSPTNFRMNILELHDKENDTSLASQAASGNPVLCAKCHADPALGLPGEPGLPSFSAAMHGEHKDKTTDCYACHPGPDTKCLRGTMANDYQMECVDCHVGGMEALADENRTPWVDEPRCGDCHEPQYAENPGKLFRESVGHGGLYCESCHNSTHAILPSRDADDNLQSIALQGYAGTIQECTVCHLDPPVTPGPHGLMP